MGDSALHFRVKEMTTIPPFTDMPVNVVTHVNEGACLVLPEGSRVKGIAILPALYSISEGETFLHLINLTPTPIRLHNNTRVVDYELAKGEVMELPPPAFTATTQTQPTLGESSPSSHETLSTIPSPDFDEGYEILSRLFREYPSLLPSEFRPLGKTDLLQHKINLVPNAQPVYIPSYRIPHSRRSALDKATADLLDQGIITPSTSPWSAPMLLVPKKDGTMRPVIDYRRLNKLTIPEPFPIPSLRLLLQDIGTNNKVFSTLDLAKGFHQLPMHPDSQKLTAFSTPSGHWEFTRMPFGLRNAPLSFARLMSLVMSGLVGNDVLIYLNDFLVVSKDVAEHEVKLWKIFSRLSEAGLTINPQKCRFFASSLEFLGHTVTSAGISPNDDKVKSISNFPVPKDQHQIKSFLGLAGFYRPFIPHFGSIASPLSRLLKRDSEFVWGKEQDFAFQSLKSRLIKSPVLAFPDFSKPFILATDASNVGIGSALMQEFEGKLKPIAFASRVLNIAEKRYSTSDKELLSIIWSLKHFRELILGYDIEVRTDHQPLTHIMSCKDPHGRLARHLDTLLEFNPSIVYTPGPCNKVADALSRAPVYSLFSDNCPPLDALDINDIKEKQRSDTLYKDIIKSLEANPSTPLPPRNHLPVKDFYLDDSGLLFRLSMPKRKGRKTKISYRQLVIPECLVPLILKYSHESLEAAHAGASKAVKRARSRFYFPRLSQRVFRHVKSCRVCPLYKGSTHQPAPALLYDIPDFPFQKVSCDTLSGFIPSPRGNRYILVFIDNFSRYCELVPVPDKSAHTIARAFYNNIICRYQSPQQLSSDNGTEFCNKILSQLCSLMNVKKVNILPYRPQANGITERLNKTILNLMRTMITDHDDDWDLYLPIVQSAINCNYHSSLGDIPHFLLFGTDKRLPYELLDAKPDPNYDDNYAKTLLIRQQKAFTLAKEKLTLSRDKIIANQHKIARFKAIDVGALVFRSIKSTNSPMPKLAPIFDGPYRVLQCRNNKALCRSLKDESQTWFHFDQLKLANKYFVEQFSDCSASPDSRSSMLADESRPLPVPSRC